MQDQMCEEIHAINMHVITIVQILTTDTQKQKAQSFPLMPGQPL